MKKLLVIPAILLLLSAVPDNRIQSNKKETIKPIDKLDIINKELDSINILIQGT